MENNTPKDILGYERRIPLVENIQNQTERYQEHLRLTVVQVFLSRPSLKHLRVKMALNYYYYSSISDATFLPRKVAFWTSFTIFLDI